MQLKQSSYEVRPKSDIDGGQKDAPLWSANIKNTTVQCGSEY